MKFGLFGGARNRTGEPDGYSQGYREYIDTIVEAESLGYHSSFLVEHHFTGAGQVSASLNLLTYLAARTTTMRLGTAVVVVPWHNPVLLAEQAATVDLLSGGRLDLGVGKGYRHNEFHGFCIPMEEAQDRFEETMALIRKAWTTEGRFSHHSARWDFEDIVVEPPPVQKPHPPLWLAAGRPDSLRYTAREGYRLMLDQFATFEVIAERLAVYREALEEEGRPYDPMGVAVARAFMIVDSAAEREDAIERRARMLENINVHGVSPDGRHRSSMVSDPDLVRATEEGALIGPVDEIADRCRKLQEGGVEYVLLSNTLGTRDALRAFAREVMPRLA